MFLLNLAPFEILTWVIGFLLALTCHEAAHALCANFLGDPTAKFAGRISANPLAHLDLMGTLFLLFVGVGWGKPVPVNPLNFANPRAGEILTALAGPLANFVVALLLAIPYNFFAASGTDVEQFLGTLIFINILILVFNLLPIPPLDGGGVVANILPLRYKIVYEQYGPFFLFGVIAFGLVFDFNILWGIILPVANAIWFMLNLATGFYL